MTKSEFIHQYMLKRTTCNSDTRRDLEYAIEAAALIESKGFAFDAEDSISRLTYAIGNGLNIAQSDGGFCLQFNREHPLQVENR